MATSDDAAYVRFSEALLDDGDFCDAGMLNRCIGNLNHLADQYAQNRIKWIMPAGGSGFAPDSDLTISASTYFSDEGPPLINWRSPAFDLHVRETGNTYVCRVRLYTKSSHATHTATFRAALVPARSTVAEEIAAAGVNVATSTPTASTAYAWEDLSTLIYLDAGMTARSREGVSTIDSVGGEERGASWLRVELVVVSQVINTAATALLGGVELTEYLPP